jgi:hypothetical protein
MKRDWLKRLSKRSKALIDNGYTFSPAMTEAWDQLYDAIVQDIINEEFSISNLRDSFFNESIDELERYENEIVERYED